MVWDRARNSTACRVVRNQENTVRIDIVCRVANGAKIFFSGIGSIDGPYRDRVLSGLIHRDIVDDVINECRNVRSGHGCCQPCGGVLRASFDLFFGEAYEEVMHQLVTGYGFWGTGGMAGRAGLVRPWPAASRPGPTIMTTAAVSPSSDASER